MTIFVFFCIGAGLVLSGVFISKALSPTKNCPLIDRNHGYNVCVRRLRSPYKKGQRFVNESARTVISSVKALVSINMALVHKLVHDK